MNGARYVYDLIVYGEIPDIPEGSVFENRIHLSLAGVHRQRQGGIVGTVRQQGAESIVMSGGYEDDEDLGDVIIYTGHGGNDPATGRQNADQDMTRHNAALAMNVTNGVPVRVIRGYKLESMYAPENGYRYDGLYRVEDYWREKGRSGYYVWRFRLVKVTNEPSPETTTLSTRETKKSYSPGNESPQRMEVRTQRIVRTTAVGEYVKGLYDCACQRCGLRIVSKGGPYAEAAHIRPLGRPHDGPDVPENVLCLCPNCHTEFDFGVWAIADDHGLVGVSGKMTLHASHNVDSKHLAYRRQMSGL